MVPAVLFQSHEFVFRVRVCHRLTASDFPERCEDFFLIDGVQFQDSLCLIVDLSEHQQQMFG